MKIHRRKSPYTGEKIQAVGKEAFDKLWAEHEAQFVKPMEKKKESKKPEEKKESKEKGAKNKGKGKKK